MKECPRCKELKPTSEFHKNRSRADGLGFYCKPCFRVRRGPRTERHREVQRKWLAANREHKNAVRRRWCAKNKGKISELNRRHRERHPGESGRKAPYRAANAERIRLWVSEWRKRNPDYAMRHRRASPEKVRAANDAHRARKLGAEGRHTGEDVERQYRAQKGCCFYCGEPLKARYHRDHRIPLKRGGTNWPENIACACARCNLRKNTKTDVEFMALLAAEKQSSRAIA